MHFGLSGPGGLTHSLLSPLARVQVGGGPSRWRTYHQLHVLERALRRMAPPAGKGEGGLASPGNLEAPLLSWALPAVLRLTLCLHAIWDPPVRQAGSGARSRWSAWRDLS